MICAQCSEPVPDAANGCPHCGGDPRLAARYRLDAIVGHGAQGTTYRATRLADATTVAVKELLVRKVESLKALELFEREARVLEQLEHPGVPRLFEELQVDSGRSVALYLVQEFVEGRTLADELAQRRPTQKDVFEAAAEILDTLAYLHALRPPVIHRDIKPTNIMRRDRDGRLVLIDFGSVRAAIDTVEGGSTVAGTFGYMSPEQFMGRAIPATDIYGLGATIVAALSGSDPQALLGSDRTLQWRGRLGLDASFAAILERMLDPDPANRADDASKLAALIRAALRGEPVPMSVALPADLGLVPPAPRDLPSDFRKTYVPNSRFGMMFGAFFFLVGLFVSGVPLTVGLANGELLAMLSSLPIFLVCCGIGAIAVGASQRKLKAAQNAYRDGVAGAAFITDVGVSSYAVNNRRANVYRYEVEVPSGTSEGEHHSWKALDLRPGDSVTVLYDPADSRSSVLYDPERYAMRRTSRPSREVEERQVVFATEATEATEAKEAAEQPEEAEQQEPESQGAW